jgi:polygalacturonase
MKTHKMTEKLPVLLALGALALSGALAGCGQNVDPREPFQVGTVTYDPQLPPEPALPTPDQVCTTLYARDYLVKRPDGALPPEADPTPAKNIVGDPQNVASTTIANPDQVRIQAALNACGQLVDQEVGATIVAADQAALVPQYATSNVKNLAGASGEELAKPQYVASKFAVRLMKSPGGGDSFISGPLTLPSGVTLWIDEGVTLFATRDVMAYHVEGKAGTGPKWCGNVALEKPSLVGGVWQPAAVKAGSSGNCKALINGDQLVNSAVVGDGSIDSRAYAELVSSDGLYPLMKVDLTCTNTYLAWATTTVRAVDGTPCDNGGTFVDSKSGARNMTWWDLAYLGNMVENGRTGASSQSNFRMMVFNYAKNLTLYRITLNNSANFHVVPAGVDGLTVWGVKLQTPSLAAYANPAGNSNPLYTGARFDKDNVKNTDAFDPASSSASKTSRLTIGADTTTGAALLSSAAAVQFDGYLKNAVFAFNHVSTGDDDIVLKGSNNPRNDGTPAIDGNRDVRSDRAHGIVIAHNHIYWGHGISIGSETNAGVTNVWVYDNSMEDSEEGLRIKSDYARGGEVSNIFYENICIRNAENALLFTPYYSTKALTTPPLIPNFHDIHLRNVRILGESSVRLMGFAENTGGWQNPQYPLVMSLDHVVADDPNKIAVISSDAALTLEQTNLPIFASQDARVITSGLATRAVDPAQAVDCSRAFMDFPTLTSPAGQGW